MHVGSVCFWLFGRSHYREQDLPSHFQTLDMAFEKFHKAGLKVILNKYEFLDFFFWGGGHVVDDNGIPIVCAKVTAVKKISLLHSL